MKKLMVSIGLSIGLSFTSVVRASDSYEAPHLEPWMKGLLKKPVTIIVNQIQDMLIS